MKKILILNYIVLFLLSCSVQPPESTSNPISHEIWNTLVKKHITETGNTNYKGFQQDSVQLYEYLNVLKNNHPNETNWNKEERIAYWINAYNAFTVQLIVENYPVKSIKDIKKGIPFINSVWDIRFIEIEGMEYDLNNIEHSILRKEFDEPRIHFAINCASFSCPRLRTEAFTADKLEKQLQDQAIYFINNPAKNIIAKDRVEVSKIFSWFKGDFTKKSDLIEFLNLYSQIEIDENAKVQHLDYNWNLNE